MCFSPDASFIAATLLTGIGITTLRKVRKKHEFLLATLPLLFALQQFTEGLLWLTLSHKDLYAEQHWLTIIFISFAGIIWPLLVPLSIFAIETSGHRKEVVGIFLLSGVAIASLTFITIINFGVSSEIVNSCIRYDSPLKRGGYVTLLYVMATCGPLLYSSYKNIIRIGGLNLVALIIAYYFYEFAYASVWCFFAVAISALIYLHFSENQKKPSAAA